MYEYVRSDPNGGNDPLGLLTTDEDLGNKANPKPCTCPKNKQRSKDQCCAAAKANPEVNKGDIGGVVCCDGQLVACVFKTGGGFFGADPTFAAIADKCVLAHENNHIPRSAGCGIQACGALRRNNRTAYWNLHHVADECLAYEVEAACLMETPLSACTGKCFIEFTNHLNDVLAEVAKRCGAAW
jgi:hypothetical protein